MKPFNLDEAKRGAPVRTLAGDKVRLFAFDSNCVLGNEHPFPHPIVGEVQYRETGHVAIQTWGINGRTFSVGDPVLGDLCMSEETQMRYFLTWKVMDGGKIDRVNDVAYAESHALKLVRDAKESHLRQRNYVYDIETSEKEVTV